MNFVIKAAFSFLVIILAAVIVISFFMPWAKVDISVTKVSKELVGAASGTLSNTPFAGKFIKGLNETTNVIGGLGDIEVKTSVSGYDIPTMVNKKESKVALSLAQVLFKDAKDLDKKSLLVYLLPVFAVICAILVVAGIKYGLAIMLTLILSGGISIGGLYNLKTMDLSNLMVRITIEKGLWQTMYAYLAIFIICAAWLTMDVMALKRK